jgi:hypothetical protein
VNIGNLIRRAKLQAVTLRAQDIDDAREMLAGTYYPTPGMFTPKFKPGTSRELAWHRALHTTTTVVPIIINKSLAGIDFGAITWSDAETRTEEVDDAVAKLDLAQLAYDLAVEFKITGAAAGIASTPFDENGSPMDPTIHILHGLNIPYSDPRDPSRVTGWFRAVQYSDQTNSARLRWWVETYDWAGIEEGQPITHRVWQALTDPTAISIMPDDEYTSVAKPRYILNGTDLSGLPISPILQNMGRILGIFATELRLSTTEELAAFPMFMTKGEVELDAVGPAETVAVESAGDAKWLDPGSLEELREQLRVKRDQLREAFNLPGGSLGTETPSGEALAEANRGFVQESQGLASMLSGVLTDLVSDYLRLLGLPEVEVHVPIDRSYLRDTQIELVEKGIDLGVLPRTVAARVFQQFIGSYSDAELREFTDMLEEQSRSPITGQLAAADR